MMRYSEIRWFSMISHRSLGIWLEFRQPFEGHGATPQLSTLTDADYQHLYFTCSKREVWHTRCNYVYRQFYTHESPNLCAKPHDISRGPLGRSNKILLILIVGSTCFFRGLQPRCTQNWAIDPAGTPLQAVSAAKCWPWPHTWHMLHWKRQNVDHILKRKSITRDNQEYLG